MLPPDPAPSSFDVDAFRSAFVAKDIDAWTAFSSDDVDWLEYDNGRIVRQVDVEAWDERPEEAS